MKTICITLILAAIYGTAIKPGSNIARKDIERSLVLIPKGIVHCCNMSDDNRVFSAFNFQQTVDSFYICRHEVNNGEYLAFLNDISKDTALYNSMLPDTMVWMRLNKVGDPFAGYQPFMRYYLRHEAYSDYPLVGIRYEQATRFCEWMTEKYMADPKRRYRKVRFSLPTLAQWVYAAGDSRNFPVGDRLQNDKGQWLANFTVFEQGSIGRVTIPLYSRDSLITQTFYLAAQANNFRAIPQEKESYILTPVESYRPGTNGLYNQAGNVEEYVREKGYTKGGSWRDPGYYLQNMVEETYDSTNSASAERGFRYVMEIVK